MSESISENKRQRQGGEERSRARIEAATRALRALIRDAFVARYGPKASLAPLDMQLKLTVDPAADWSVAFAPDLLEQLLPHFETLEADRDVYRAGRVHCFRCERSDCDHSRPRQSREVFAGYDPLGSPCWQELAPFLLERGDERVEQLYGARPGLIALQLRGRELKERQLAAFGKSSKTYGLLGQVVVGYLPLSRGEGELLALTFQAVEVRDRQGAPRVELNTLCGLPAAQELAEALVDRQRYVLEARAIALDALAKLNREMAALPPLKARDQMRIVPEILRRLVTELERGKRLGARRTDHAVDRQELLARPVDKAMADLREAKPDRFYLDAKTQTIVVHADKGRCHVFSESGRHVTSFVIQTEAVRHRLRKRRWVDLAQEQRLAFLAVLEGS